MFAKKNFQNSLVVFLNNHEEAIGRLEDIKNTQDYVILSITQERKISLPLSALTKAGLNDCIGKKIGIYNCDGTYFWRQIDQGGC